VAGFYVSSLAFEHKEGFGPMVMQVFQSILAVSPFADGKYWYLLNDLLWRSERDVSVIVPAGFVTDFTSVPRPLWIVLPKWAKYGNAAVVHDYLYWEQTIFDRRTADQLMAEAMRDMKVSWITRQLIYRALRVTGGWAWAQNRARKVGGEIRILRPEQFPTDPLETWADCRRRITTSINGA
jgi:hypothetical protein